MKRCPHEGAPAPHEVAFYLVQSTINPHELSTEAPRGGRESALASWRVRRMAGSNGMPATPAARRLTAAENAIEAAVLEQSARPSPRLRGDRHSCSAHLSG